LRFNESVRIIESFEPSVTKEIQWIRSIVNED